MLVILLLMFTIFSHNNPSWSVESGTSHMESNPVFILPASGLWVLLASNARLIGPFNFILLCPSSLHPNYTIFIFEHDITCDWVYIRMSPTVSLHQCFSIFLLELNPLERLDCSWNPCSDTRVCSIPNRQKQHFSVFSNLHEKTPIDTGVCV